MTLHAFIGAAIHDGTKLHHGKALIVEGKKTAGLVDANDLPDGCTLQHLNGGILAPGFVDLQVNGGGGVLFNDDPSLKSLMVITAAHRKRGTYAILPTLITDTAERSRAAIEAVREAVDMGMPGIAGLHLEGPHLSLARKGAHDGDLIRPMGDSDLAMICDAAQHLPNLKLTIAPENVSLEQVKTMAKAGVILSLGHTDADYATCIAYARAGVRCVTHLFNAMSQLGNREPGLVGAALNSSGLCAGLIADGVHVHPASIRTALRAKPGAGELFLVTDAMSTFESDQTEFTLNGRTIKRQDGTLRLADGTLAGADVDMPRALAVLVNQVGLSPERAIAMATSGPASQLKRITGFGTLTPGGLRPIYLSDNLSLQPLPWHPVP